MKSNKEECVLSARVRDGRGMSCQGGGRYAFTYIFFDRSGVASVAVNTVVVNGPGDICYAFVSNRIVGRNGVAGILGVRPS
jgi:hypothetical protein